MARPVYSFFGNIIGRAAFAHCKNRRFVLKSTVRKGVPVAEQAFCPDYTQLVKAAWNQTPERIPLYEHMISETMMEEILGEKFLGYHAGDLTDKKTFFSGYCRFFQQMGYDTVSFERGIAPVMPGSGALGSHRPGAIKNRADFEAYPWEEIPDKFFQEYQLYFDALRMTLPPGMKAVGGPGNGIFECVQDIVGYTDLCYIKSDDPELYADLFKKTADISLQIWERFLQQYADMYCVLRFGDDLGYKSQTLLSPQDIRQHILPGYRKIVAAVHRYNKPFLLHSCGNILAVMPDLLDTVKINAKHSNEDMIAPFSFWMEQYGDRIGNFGGIDTDALCRLDASRRSDYIRAVFAAAEGRGGFAFGSGNSIPDYVPVENYLGMIRTARLLRGESGKLLAACCPV